MLSLGIEMRSIFGWKSAMLLSWSVIILPVSTSRVFILDISIQVQYENVSDSFSAMQGRVDELDTALSITHMTIKQYQDNIESLTLEKNITNETLATWKKEYNSLADR